MAEPRQKLRARFAMWVLGLISPWLSLWDEGEPEYIEPDERLMQQVYDDAMEKGYKEGFRDGQR